MNAMLSLGILQNPDAGYVAAGIPSFMEYADNRS